MAREVFGIRWGRDGELEDGKHFVLKILMRFPFPACFFLNPSTLKIFLLRIF